MSGRQSAAVDRAMQRIAKKECSAYRAAKDEGLALSTIYRAIDRAKKKKRGKR